MKGSYLFDLLSSLSPAEIPQFLRFAKEQLQGAKGDEKAWLLIEWLLAQSLKGQPVLVDRQAAIQKLFPGNPPREGKFDKVMATANKALKAFLLQQHYNNPENAVQRELDLIEVLQQRGLDGWKKKNLEKLVKDQRQRTVKGTRNFVELFHAEFLLFQDRSANNHLNEDLNVPAALDALDDYYLVSRLELLNSYLLQQKVTKMPKEHEVLTVLTPLEEQRLPKTPVLLIAGKIHALLQQELPPISAFQELSTLLLTYEKQLAPVLLQQYFTFLRNFVVLQINAGHNDLMPIYQQLIRDNLERGYFYHEGKRLSASAYLSIMAVAIQNKDIDWAGNFIESHKGRVIGDNVSFDLYRLNKAHYLFALGQYQAALDHIAPVFEYINYTLMAKRLEIKALYELESDLLPYKIGAFKIFITRASQKSMPNVVRRPNADFINFLHQILRSKPGDQERKERLTARIHAKPHTAARDWLLEKIAEKR